MNQTTQPGIEGRTPEKVLKRWVWEHGLHDLSPQAMEPLFEKVEGRVSANYQDPGSVGEASLVYKTLPRTPAFASTIWRISP